MTGDLAARSREAVLAIASDIEDEISGTTRSVEVDPRGYAILYAYLAIVYDESRYAELAQRCHAEAVAQAHRLGDNLALHGGLCGLGWLDAHLRRLCDEPNDEDSEIDQLLNQRLKSGPWTGQYDLIGGLAGFAVYCAEREPTNSGKACLELVVERLCELAKPQDGGVAWHTPSELVGLPETQAAYPFGWFNLGLAHGAPGAIAVLGLSARYGVNTEQCERTLRGATAWLLSQRLSYADLTFPAHVAPGEHPLRTRCAWCYGDPGVGIALKLAGDAVRAADISAAGVSIALRSLGREPRETGVVDAGLCHGSAGLMQIAMRLAWSTGSQEFADLARLWAEQTLNYRRPGIGVGGFLSWGSDRSERGRSRPTWQLDAGFLTGASGIALALLAATSDTEPCWDRLLLLS